MLSLLIEQTHTPALASRGILCWTIKNSRLSPEEVKYSTNVPAYLDSLFVMLEKNNILSARAIIFLFYFIGIKIGHYTNPTSDRSVGIVPAAQFSFQGIQTAGTPDGSTSII